VTPSIYITIYKSFFLLGIYTLVSVIVPLLWLALLHSYVRLLVYGMCVAAPVILYSFTLYAFISSFRGSWQGESTQDSWGSAVPFALASCSWIQGRHATRKAISILEFSCPDSCCQSGSTRFRSCYALFNCILDVLVDAYVLISGWSPFCFEFLHHRH
jgi:hypothetical protein